MASVWLLVVALRMRAVLASQLAGIPSVATQDLIQSLEKLQSATRTLAEANKEQRLVPENGFPEPAASEELSVSTKEQKLQEEGFPEPGASKALSISTRPRDGTWDNLVQHEAAEGDMEPRWGMLRREIEAAKSKYSDVLPHQHVESKDLPHQHVESKPNPPYHSNAHGSSKTHLHSSLHRKVRNPSVGHGHDREAKIAQSYSKQAMDTGPPHLSPADLKGGQWIQIISKKGGKPEWAWLVPVRQEGRNEAADEYIPPPPAALRVADATSRAKAGAGSGLGSGVPESQEYKEHAKSGATTGQYHFPNGTWTLGKMPAGEPNHGYWQWELTPDGEWTLVWLEKVSIHTWRWWRPNDYTWTGPHRRRQTWSDISGRDFQEGNHDLQNTMWDPSLAKAFRLHEKDEDWMKGMKPPAVGPRGQVNKPTGPTIWGGVPTTTLSPSTDAGQQQPTAAGTATATTTVATVQQQPLPGTGQGPDVDDSDESLSELYRASKSRHERELGFDEQDGPHPDRDYYVKHKVLTVPRGFSFDMVLDALGSLQVEEKLAALRQQQQQQQHG